MKLNKPKLRRFSSFASIIMSKATVRLLTFPPALNAVNTWWQLVLLPLLNCQSWLLNIGKLFWTANKK